MTVYQQVLWMLISIRVLGRRPRLPLSHDSLIRYAAALEIQYSHISTHLGIARRRESAVIASRLVDLLGLTEAAEPLPRRLLDLLERHGRQRAAQTLPAGDGSESACPQPPAFAPPR